MSRLIRQPQSGMLTDARQTMNFCDPDGSRKVRRPTWKYLAPGCSRALVSACRVNGRCANFPDCCLNARLKLPRLGKLRPRAAGLDGWNVLAVKKHSGIQIPISSMA